MRSKKVIFIIGLLIGVVMFGVLLWQFSGIRALTVNLAINDRDALMMIALKDENHNVIHAAVGKLADQDALAGLALASKCDEARKVAANKLINPVLLGIVALKSKDDVVAKIAVGKMTDLVALAKVSLEGTTQVVRESAAEKLTEQNALAKIAVDDEFLDFREAATNNLTNPILLDAIALKDQRSSVRKAAVGQLTNQTVLAQIALQDKDKTVRKTAVHLLTNKPILVEVALKDEDRSVQIEALNNITDPRVLAEQAVETKDRKILKDVRAILVFLSTCETLPKEHRERLSGHLLDIVRTLRESDNADVFGDLILLGMDWESQREEYTLFGIPIDPKRNPGVKPRLIKGESFTVLAYSKSNCLFYQQAITKFPQSVSFGTEFIPAEFNVDNGTREGIPFRRIGNPDEEFFTEQSLLENIVSNSRLSAIRQAAKKRLNDLALTQLVNVIKEDKHLAPVIDKFQENRDFTAAISRIDDALSEILPMENKISDVRGGYE